MPLQQKKIAPGETELPALSHKEFLRVDRDYAKAAKVVNLIYVKDSDPGISRLKKGKGFIYLADKKPITEKAKIERIKKLAIPPAWIEVWICPQENGHIQATGLDARKRKQYRYHPLWNLLRNETKFHHLYEFGNQLPALRQRIKEDMQQATLNQDKVLATVISLMERTYIRIGNSGYEKMYGSYGLTTLKDQHVSISGAKLNFSFKGKKGIIHHISLRNKWLAKTVKACRDIPGKELFQYYDAEGNRHSIDSGMVNNYLKEIIGADFTAKDFRTWAGSLHALQAFRSIGEAISDAERKRNIVAMFDQVSEKLGNTRNVCKKYYVHPTLVKLYEENKLKKYLIDLDKSEKKQGKDSLTPEEKVLMKILKRTVPSSLTSAK